MEVTTTIGALAGAALLGTGAGVAFGIIGAACGIVSGGTIGGLGGFLSKYF